MLFCLEDPLARKRGALLVQTAGGRATKIVPQQRLLPLGPLASISAAASPKSEAAVEGEEGAGLKTKRRHRQHVRPPALPHSLAPWHTVPYLGHQVHYLGLLLSAKVTSSLTQARASWHEHRAAVRTRRARSKGGSGHRHLHLHLPLPWRRHGRHRQQNSHTTRVVRGPHQEAEAAAERGFRLQKELDFHGAVAAFEEANRLVPNNAYYLACLSKTWSDITFIPGTPSAEAKCCAEKGMDFAEQALKADPNFALGHIAACVSKGRLTFFVDNRRKVELAASAQRDALAALEADPNSDLAHHLMGRWHWEMAQLNFVVRALIRMVYGAALQPGTHVEAAAAFQQAADLAPQRLIHRVELARSALRLGQYSRAARELQIAMELEIEDINAHLTRLDGVEMLEKLRKQGRLHDVLQPALPLPQAAQPQPTAVIAASDGSSSRDPNNS